MPIRPWTRRLTGSCLTVATDRCCFLAERMHTSVGQSNPSGFVFAVGSRDGAFPSMKYEGDRCPITDGADMLSEFVDDNGDADSQLKNWHFSFYNGKSYL